MQKQTAEKPDVDPYYYLVEHIEPPSNENENDPTKPQVASLPQSTIADRVVVCD